MVAGRRPHLPTLDDYDRSNVYDRNDHAPYARKPKGGSRHVPPGAPPIGDGACWCGQSFGHDWPGKADGEAHPR